MLSEENASSVLQVLASDLHFGRGRSAAHIMEWIDWKFLTWAGGNSDMRPPKWPHALLPIKLLTFLKKALKCRLITGCFYNAWLFNVEWAYK